MCIHTLKFYVLFKYLFWISLMQCHKENAHLIISVLASINKRKSKHQKKGGKNCMINEPHFYLKIKCNLSIFSWIKSFNGSNSNDNPQWQTDHIWPRQRATWWKRVQRQSEEEAYFGLCAQTRGWGYLYLPIGAGEARWAAQFWWGPLTPKVEANSSGKSTQTMKISH